MISAEARQRGHAVFGADFDRYIALGEGAADIYVREILSDPDPEGGDPGNILTKITLAVDNEMAEQGRSDEERAFAVESTLIAFTARLNALADGVKAQAGHA